MNSEERMLEKILILWKTWTNYHLEQNPIIFPQKKKYDQRQFFSALQNELDQMEIEQQTTFLLRFQQNLSIKEISNILECSEGTIKSRLFYTTKKLAARLKDFNPNNTEVPLNAKIR